MEYIFHACVVIFATNIPPIETSIKYPFQDPNLTLEKRVNDLVSRLTIEEIANQTLEITNDAVPNSVPRLGIRPFYWVQECLRGQGRTNATAFPQAIGLSAAWSIDLLYNVSEAVSLEVRGHWNSYQRRGLYSEARVGLSCYSPVINIARYPLWGRNQETYGECPHLTGSLVESFVRGLQGPSPKYLRAAAGCKHFDAHGGPETIPSSRFSFNAKVTSRDWRMTFLPAFKKCVEAESYGIMCSYNSINGVPSCANKKLLTDILRTEWGFQGVVVSDAGAIDFIQSEHKYTHSDVDTVAAAISAGCNAELPLGQHVKSSDVIYRKQIDAVKQGKLTEQQLRDNVAPMFRTRIKLGEFDPPSLNPYTAINMSVVQSPEHRHLAVTAAQMSFTLLKNHENALPLKSKVHKLALVGPFSNLTDDLFGDYSSEITPEFTRTVYQGLKDLAIDETRLASGCDSGPLCKDYNQDSVSKAVSGSDLVIVALGTGLSVESEGRDRANLDLPGKQLDLLKDAVFYAKGTKLILLLFTAGPLDITWAKYVDGVHAILVCYFPAQATGEALYSMLIGANGPVSVPAGRLTITWPANIEQVSGMTDYSMVGHTYRYYRGDPLYPFGYGLSYTEFRYSSLSVTPVVNLGQSVNVSVMVENIGSYDADEVIQVYLTWPEKYQYTYSPVIQLVDFTRKYIPRGRKIPLNFSIKPEQLALWVDDNMRWRTPPGVLTVYVGGQQPRQRTTVNSNVLSSTFTVKTSTK